MRSSRLMETRVATSSNLYPNMLLQALVSPEANEDLKDGSCNGLQQYAALGRDRVSKLGFRCAGLSINYYNNLVSEEAGIEIIKDAFSKGITFFDTSDVYGGKNANKYLVGKILKQLPREKIQLATKFGVQGVGPNGMIVNGKPEYVHACCKASLSRLGVDYIDLYYMHRIDKTVPIEETVGEMKKLVEEGKVKYIGLSEASPDTIRRAHAVHPSPQFKWSGHFGVETLKKK